MRVFISCLAAARKYFGKESLKTFCLPSHPRRLVFEGSILRRLKKQSCFDFGFCRLISINALPICRFSGRTYIWSKRGPENCWALPVPCVVTNLRIVGYFCVGFVCVRFLRVVFLRSWGDQRTWDRAELTEGELYFPWRFL